jgi:hypothetical protein
MSWLASLAAPEVNPDRVPLVPPLTRAPRTCPRTDNARRVLRRNRVKGTRTRRSSHERGQQMHPDILVALLSRGCWLRAVNARHVGRQSHKGNGTHSHERNDTEYEVYWRHEWNVRSSSHRDACNSGNSGHASVICLSEVSALGRNGD